MEDNHTNLWRLDVRADLWTTSTWIFGLGVDLTLGRKQRNVVVVSLNIRSCILITEHSVVHLNTEDSVVHQIP
jgi:hypothetical protein